MVWRVYNLMCGGGGRTAGRLENKACGSLMLSERVSELGCFASIRQATVGTRYEQRCESKADYNIHTTYNRCIREKDLCEFLSLRAASPFT